MAENKTVIITGASSGIGRACALHFAANGWKVALSGRNAERLHAVASEILKNQPGAQVLEVVTDVDQESSCRELISKTVETFGGVDALLNNAGISMRGLFNETDLSVIKKLMNTNFWGAVYCTKYALPHLLHSGGSVVGVSSIAGKKGLPGRTGYSASKFALEGFLETLRTENLKTGLHVMVACPGFTASAIRMSSLGPDGKPQGESPRDEKGMMSAEAVAARIYSGVIRRKRDLIMTSNGKFTVLLNKFFPGYMDKLVYKYMSREPGSPFK